MKRTGLSFKAVLNCSIRRGIVLQSSAPRHRVKALFPAPFPTLENSFNRMSDGWDDEVTEELTNKV